MRNNFLLYLLIAVLGGCIFVNFSLIETKENTPTGSSTQIANPASVYCVNQGGKLEIRKDEAGNETGYCLFTNGQECEEWAYYRSECNPVGQATQFCGSSTLGKCADNTDCTAGGCSGQVCQSISEESIISTCEYQDCYDAKKFGLTCDCLNQQCQWTK